MGTLYRNQVLTNSFVASKPLIISGSGIISLEFTVVVSGGATEVQWFLEFSNGTPDPLSANYFREIAEENQGNGNVNMPKVVRSLLENGGANLANGTHRLSLQFQRRQKFYRLQAQQVAGGGNAILTVEDVFADDLSLVTT